MTAYDEYAEALSQGEKGIGRRARVAGEMHTAYLETATRFEAPDAMRKAALWYARQGIAVFPVIPGEKRPATEHGFKDATIDDDFVTAAWTVQPDYNIGLPTGELFDVIDVDGPEGVASFMYGHTDWRDGLIGHSLTQRPHSHHLFYKPSGRGNGANVMPGVDYRGVGGYVLAPPSVGPTGVRYRWILPLSLTDHATE